MPGLLKDIAGPLLFLLWHKNEHAPTIILEDLAAISNGIHNILTTGLGGSDNKNTIVEHLHAIFNVTRNDQEFIYLPEETMIAYEHLGYEKIQKLFLNTSAGAFSGTFYFSARRICTKIAEHCVKLYQGTNLTLKFLGLFVNNGQHLPILAESLKGPRLACVVRHGHETRIEKQSLYYCLFPQLFLLCCHDFSKTSST